jgi:hypothetical protein
MWGMRRSETQRILEMCLRLCEMLSLHLHPCETQPLQQRQRETLNKIAPYLKAVRCKIAQRKLRQQCVVMRSKVSKQEDSP